jgi:tetratricopeptide (TPR) repeat protein
MVRRTLVAAVALLSFAPPAGAQLDAEPKQPYLWRVVLAARPHPLVTPEFRERLRRDVLAALQTGLGAHGTVEVIDLADVPRDRWEPLWQQFDDKGFAALDAPRDLTGAKTHFLRLEYRDGKFLLESRQYDGFTGLSSPVARAREVRGAEQVGRAAGLMLDRDFGLAGTVEPIVGQAETVKVQVRGGGLGPVNGFVQTGDVFALAAVRKTNRPAPPPVRTATGKIIAPPAGSGPPPGLTSTPRNYALLKVSEVLPDGTLRCTVLFADPAKAMPPTGGVVGYRCMKLGTVRAPVAVRLVGSDGTVYKTASTVSVRASDLGFPNPAAPDQRDACTFHAGTAQFRTQRALANVACVTVTLGSQSKLFAVPVLNDDPITLPFDVDPAKAERAEYERAVFAVAARANDARLAQTVCFEEVTRLIDKRKNADALARAEGGVKSTEADVTGLGDDYARLKEQLDKSPGAAPVLEKIRQNIDTLGVYNAQLKGHAEKIRDVVKRENDPSVAARDVQAQALHTRITLLRAAGEVDQALVAYDQLIALVPDSAEAKAQRDQLAAEWKVKDDAHQKARDYLLKTWPAVATIQDYKDALPQIRAAVDVCKKHGDKWTLRKLLTGFSTVGVKLKELVEALDPAQEADRKLLIDANAVGKVLGALEVELRGLVGE